MFGIYTKFRKYSIKLAENSTALYYQLKRGSKEFVFNGQKYRYFIHPYNHTWSNERIIEIPIIKKVLEENKNKKILEVGNVMVHYSDINHDVLDKYEVYPGVINKDVVDFKSNKKYDLVICVSTLEHVGWDENGQDYKKILKVIPNLKKLLSKNGRILVTHPLGYNWYMDEYIKSGKLDLNKIWLMVRDSQSNTWTEQPWKKQIIRYHHPFPYANGLIIGEILK